MMDDVADKEKGITVRALHSLKAGEEFTYYRGHLPGDIHASARVPDYARVLQCVYDAAHALAASGKIALRTQEEIIQLRPRMDRNGKAVTDKVTVTRYIAIGRYG